MTIETMAAPGAAASTAAPVDNAISQGLANPADTTTEQTTTDPPPQETDHDKAVRKFERRIGTVTRQRYDAEARANQHAQENERLRAELEQARQSRTQPAGDAPQGEPSARREQQPQRQALTREEFEAAVARESEQRARVSDASRRANEIFSAGQKAFGEEFGSAVRAVQEEAGSLYERNGLPTALGEAIGESENPAALLQHLGQNPDDAAELRGLSAAALGRRIAKLEAQIAAAPPQKPAQAHKPVTSSATAATKDPSKMSDAEWHAQRKAQKR